MINENIVSKHYGMEYVDNATLFRSIAPKIDIEPDHIYQYISEKPAEALYSLRTLNAETFFRLYEASSYGDVGSLFAAPRTCLSGILLQFIGNSEQQDYYFGAVKQSKKRTFFATTEINRGSDAANLETTFIDDSRGQNIEISGDKILVGNLGVADLGVIVGRSAKGPLGISMVLVTPSDFANNLDRVNRRTLEMFGVRAAMLGEARFNKFSVSKAQLLGTHIRAAERGLQALIKTFNIMRIAIAGLALGHAQAMVDYIRGSRQMLSLQERNDLDNWDVKIKTIRQFGLNVARINLIDRLNTTDISLLKTYAVKLVEHIANNAMRFYGEEFIIEHRYLVKSMRDCLGYEYMDGTTNIQRKNVFYGYANAKF